MNKSWNIWKSSIAMLLLGFVVLFIASCKDEEEPPPPVVTYGSAFINGSYATYTRYTFKKFTYPGGVIFNKITLSRSDNSQIEIGFKGSSGGEFELPNADSLNYCTFIDPGNREFEADSGSFFIDSYQVIDGKINASGFFGFRGRYVNPTSGTVSNVEISEGTFINLEDN
jgi:hypothetical protein